MPLLTVCVEQCYLPPDWMVTKDFIRQVLAEEKVFLKLAELKQVAVPKYDECSVKNMWPMVTEAPELMRHFPDRLPQGKLPDREYFFNILMSVHPDYTQEMVAHANSLRFRSGQAQDQAEQIKVTEGMWDELNSMPFFSCK